MKRDQFPPCYNYAEDASTPKNNRIIPAGQVFIVSSGEYSDYAIMAAFIATQDIDIDKAMEEFIETHRDVERLYHNEKDRFLKWLHVDRQMCQEFAVAEFHIADSNPYSRNDKYLASLRII